MSSRLAAGTILGGFILVLSGCGGGSGASVAPPNAAATASVSSGVAPLSVGFDASASADPQGRPLTYSWNFGDGSAIASGAAVSHIFNAHGNYSAVVTVSNGAADATKSIPIAVTAAPPTVPRLSIPVNVLGVAPAHVSAQVAASDREGLTLTYSISSPPSVGSAAIDPGTGAIQYSVPGFVTTDSTSFTVTVANLDASAQAEVDVILNSDPLLPYQWHLQNTGQNVFASDLPAAGNDIDVAGAWASGYTGKSIKVGVVDTGLVAAHEDLAANVDLGHSYNFLTGGNDPTPTTSGFDHGTAVAGIIAEVAFNGVGGRGVAYDATLRGYNLIADFSLANMAVALGGDPISADNDLFNASFGAVSNAIPSFSGAYQAITQTTLSMRGGLGAAIVNAAGNDFVDFEAASSPLCATAQSFEVSCGDPASDERRGGYAPIIVGALAADGTHASYSNAGSALWISAPGGEFGFNSSTVPASDFNQLADQTDALKPAIVTTSRSGCSNAEFPYPTDPLDDQGANPLAAQCQYTETMNGTSAATPIVSGVVALMLQANPNLSVRDVKYILANTARLTDPAFAGVTTNQIYLGQNITLAQGWVTNAAGYHFSNRYGFGAVDAAAAVAAAAKYTSYLPPIQNSQQYSFTASPTADVVSPGPAGAAVTYPVSEPFHTVEFAVVFVNLATTPGLICNQIQLTSPSGTTSILLHAANGFSNSGLANSRFESNAFFGEPVNGNWTLRFFDFCTPSGTQTTLSTSAPQLLLLAGH